MKKYVFKSRKYLDICSSYTHNRAHQCFTTGRRDRTIRKYSEAIVELQNGTRITYKRIADKLGISERHLRRICADKEYHEFFELQKKLIKRYNISVKNNK